MYPRITELLQDLFGINLLLPVQTFGFFLAISFIIANLFFVSEMKRKEKEGLLKSFKENITRKQSNPFFDYLINGIVGGILGYKLVFMVTHYKEFANNPQEVLLSSNGELIGIILGAAASIYFKYKDLKEENKLPLVYDKITHPYELVGNMTLIAAAAGLLGAKIFHNLENLEDFFRDPVDALISFSGLTMYGGLIVGSAAVIWYTKKNNLNIKHVIDACAPSLMLAYGTGRIGCHLSGDGDWGIENLNPAPGFLPEWFWKYTYPHNVLREGVPIPGCHGDFCFQLPNPVYPTPLYEAIACILLFFVLWTLRKRIKIPGALFCIYLILNGIERFFIEKIRVNSEYNLFGGITQAEIISTGLFLLGIGGLWYFTNQHKKNIA